MGREKAQLLDLINSAIWETPANAELFGADSDWNKIYQLAKEQASLGLAYQGMSTLSNEKKPNRIQILKWYGFVAELENHYNQHVKTLEKVFCLFDEKKPILMKGLSVAALYPNPRLRHLGDIDIFIPDFDEKKMVKFLSSKNIPTDLGHTDKHIEFKLDNVDIELHWELGRPLNPFRYKTYKSFERQASKICRVESIEGVNVNLLPLEFYSIFLLIHMVHHISEQGLGIRQICDWALYLDKYHQKMDKTLLREMLNALGLMDDWQLFACFCVKYLRLRPEASIFFNEGKSKKAEKLLDIVFSLGNFGEYNPVWQNRPKSYWNRKIEALKENIVHFKRVFAISPSNALCNILFVYTADAFKRFIHHK